MRTKNRTTIKIASVSGKKPISLWVIIGICVLPILAAVSFYMGVRNQDRVCLGGFLIILACCAVLLGTLLRTLGLRSYRFASILIIVVFGAVIAFIFYYIPNRANMFVDHVAFAPVCQGQGIAEAASYSGGPGPHQIVVLEDGNRTSYLGAPSGWLPTSVESTELVACTGPSKKVLLETCSYVGGSEIKRYGYTKEVQLLAAQTGELIVAETVHGASPRSCGQTEEKSVSSLTGKSVDLWEWLQKYVEPIEPTEFGAAGLSDRRIAITVLEVDWDAWDEIKAKKHLRDDFYAPSADEVYVMITVQVHNTRSGSEIYADDFIEERHFSIQSGYTFYQETDLLRLFRKEAGPLKPKDQFTGYLGFKLPKSAVDEGVLLLYRDGEVVLSLE